MKFRVKIRRDLVEIRPEAEAIDGKVYCFDFGWAIEESDSSLYVGEFAMCPRDFDYPKEAPYWIASGDLEAIEILPMRH